MDKNNFFTCNKFYMIIALLGTQAVFAANFNITPVGTLPTTVVAGQTVSANFMVTNLTHSARNGYAVRGLPKIVTQNTASSNCSNPINMAANASCQLQLDITGAVSSNFALCKGNSCTTATTPLNVSLANGPQPSIRAYITQQASPSLGASDPVMVCSINQTNGLLEACQPAGGGNIIADIEPQGIAINKQGNTAFLTSEVYTNSFAYQCSIVPETGLFGTCTQSTIATPTGYEPYYGFLALNTTDTLAYLVDYGVSGGRVLSCPISSNAIQSNCTDTGAPIDVNSVGITLNSTNTVAYIGNYDTNYVTTCAVNNNTFSACGNKTGDGNVTFSAPSGVALNNTGTIVYITDYTNGAVYGCDATTNTSALTFSTCFVANGTIPHAWGIALNSTNTFAYITDYYDNNVHICPITSDGSFNNCTTNSNTFITPVDIALM